MSPQPIVQDGQTGRAKWNDQHGQSRQSVGLAVQVGFGIRREASGTGGASRQGGQGFANMSEEEQRKIAQKGGEAVSKDRDHMSEIGRKGGEASGENRSGKQSASESTERDMQDDSSGNANRGENQGNQSGSESGSEGRKN